MVGWDQTGLYTVLVVRRPLYGQIHLILRCLYGRSSLIVKEAEPGTSAAMAQRIVTLPTLAGSPITSGFSFTSKTAYFLGGVRSNFIGEPACLSGLVTFSFEHST